MAILVEQLFPEGTTIEFLDDVTAEMGVVKNPPAGFAVHVHFVRDGRVHGVDVWEAVEAYETFVSTRLLPAAQKVAEQQGITLAGGPEQVITEVATIVRG